MPSIIFYRQARVDGGAHTGIDVNGDSLEYFESGTGDHDPALVWYVDLRLEGDDLPDNPEEVSQWLLDHELLVNSTYRQLAERLEVGVDPDVWPLQVASTQAPAGIGVVAVCSCMRRILARQMGKTVTDIEEHWKEYLDRLLQVQHQ